MSGRKAKAIRKSAKKAAATPAPASARPRTDFIIENVRCFAGEQRVPIRPITLLVGENSTGKTTFMGCLHTAVNLLIPSHRHYIAGSAPGFNTPPFSMGGFRDIVRVAKNGGIVDEFRLGIDLMGSDDLSSLVFTFRDSEKEAVAVKISFVFADGEKLEIAKGKGETGTVSGPGFRLRGNFPMALSLGSALVLALLTIMSDALKKHGEAGKKAMRFFKKRGLLPDDFRPEKILSEVGDGMQMMSSTFVKAFAPVRSKPKRTYSILDEEPEPEGGDIPAFLLRLSWKDPKAWRDLRGRLVDFGKESGMFSDFNVVTHGARAGGDFHLEVKTRGLKSNLADVGYGVSQIYPLLVPVMRATQKREEIFFLLQEPEVHLHPQAQAALTSFFAKSAKKDGHTFIMETHGDGIIDRVRICVSNGLIPPEDVVILYFEPQPRGNVKIHPIWLDEMSNMRGAPKGYRDFFVKEDDLLLGFKKLPKGRSRVRHR